MKSDRENMPALTGAARELGLVPDSSGLVCRGMLDGFPAILGYSSLKDRVWTEVWYPFSMRFNWSSDDRNLAGPVVPGRHDCIVSRAKENQAWMEAGDASDLPRWIAYTDRRDLLESLLGNRRFREEMNRFLAGSESFAVACGHSMSRTFPNDPRKVEESPSVIGGVREVLRLAKSAYAQADGQILLGLEQGRPPDMELPDLSHSPQKALQIWACLGSEAPEDAEVWHQKACAERDLGVADAALDSFRRFVRIAEGEKAGKRESARPYTMKFREHYDDLIEQARRRLGEAPAESDDLPHAGPSER